MRMRPGLLAVIVLALVCIGVVYAVKVCPKCGTANSDSAQFCKSCGAKLGEPEPVRPQQPRVAGHVSVSGGAASITSDPSGATVEIDGRARGRTPTDITDLGPGSHELTLSRGGYRDYSTTFTITVLTGTFVVTTDPVGADILLDGQMRGRASEGGLVLTGVTYGSHRVTARLAGYQDVVKAVDLRTAGPIGVTMRLGWGKGFLRVLSQPAGASLALNSARVGATPYAAELAPDRYVLTLSQRGYYDWVGYAQVQFAETALVNATLEKTRTRKLPFLIAGIAGLAAGAGAAYMGEADYARYRTAANPEDALKYRSSTRMWDLIRDGAAGLGAVMTVGFVVLRW